MEGEQNIQGAALEGGATDHEEGEERFALRFADGSYSVTAKPTIEEARHEQSFSPDADIVLVRLHVVSVIARGSLEA